MTDHRDAAAQLTYLAPPTWLDSTLLGFLSPSHLLLTFSEDHLFQGEPTNILHVLPIRKPHGTIRKQNFEIDCSSCDLRIAAASKMVSAPMKAPCGRSADLHSERQSLKIPFGKKSS
uniref:Uncharacterized protein n=1 Tax=Micrurus lemniscatus lemniscatus TaxID=129467 RepID=A0A2D4J3M9_MICLE